MGICPFKLAGKYGYSGCDGECMLFMRGKCAIAIMAENCLDDMPSLRKDGADNER